MDATTLERLTLFAALAALLVGCNGRAMPLQAPQAAAQPAGSGFDSTGSWMAPAAAKQDLLYVSDARGTVSVFSYPGGKQVGLLKGFQSPAGLCSDASGNVFVVDTNDFHVMKYKHGGTEPIKSLWTVGYYPFGCAVDPATGDLAVANFTSQLQGPGSVSIFRPGQAFPSTYEDPAFNAYFFCTYDDHSNLFVDGADNGSYHTEFAELSNGSTLFTTIALDKKIGYPGGVQWDGTYVDVQDTASRVLYRFKIAGSKGKSSGSVRFKGDLSSLIHQFWIQGQTIVMPYGPVARQVRDVGFWPYPAGGSATKSITVAHATELIGATISLAHK
jgi:DNA-binding beta-propeller fold protein YncE